MSDDETTTLDFSGYLGAPRLDSVSSPDACAEFGDLALPGTPFVAFRPRREPAPGALDGPGYVVLHADLVPGSAVVVGRMPDGIAGGVAEWVEARVGEVDGMPAPAVGEPGWYVPAGAAHCPRCGDQNWESVGRRCITCTDGDDAYAGGRFAEGWSAGGRGDSPGVAI